MLQDPLSDVLRRVHLQGSLLMHVAAAPPWVVEALPAANIARAVMPGAAHVMAYHVLTRGSCCAAVIGQPPVHAEPGDVLVYPHGDAHVLSSAPGMRAGYAVNPFFAAPSGRAPFRLRVRGSDVTPDDPDATPSSDATTLLCGFFGCDTQPFNPLLAHLPRLLHLRRAGPGDADPQRLVETFIRTATLETERPRPGGQALLERLSEMMFVDLVRRHLDDMPQDRAGWLAGLRDRHVGRALALLHQRPADSWSVEALSDAVGLSRSALHERFVLLLGLAPMQYLARWRMQLASDLLTHGDCAIVSVAQQVGYASEAAFVRAFGKATGVPPGRWRRARRAARG